MLFETIRAIQNVLEYRKNEDGSWRAEFHGAIEVAADGATLEECRRRMYDALDSELAVWVVEKHKLQQGSSPTVAETETPRGEPGQ